MTMELILTITYFTGSAVALLFALRMIWREQCITLADLLLIALCLLNSWLMVVAFYIADDKLDYELYSWRKDE